MGITVPSMFQLLAPQSFLLRLLRNDMLGLRKSSQPPSGLGELLDEQFLTGGKATSVAKPTSRS